MPSLLNCDISSISDSMTAAFSMSKICAIISTKSVPISGKTNAFLLIPSGSGSGKLGRFSFGLRVSLYICVCLKFKRRIRIKPVAISTVA